MGIDEMKIYHGSPFIVENPELSRGKVSNDYGRGFYCTEDVEMAKEWACKGKEPPAFVNAYELNLRGLKVLNLTEGSYTVLNWIAVLLANRTFQLDLEVAVEVRRYFIANFMPPVAAADVVVGHRADDSYFNYAEAFVNNGLSIARLNEALRLGKLGTQVALRSEKAFKALRFVDADEVPWDEYHGRYISRDSAARREWRDSLKDGASTATGIFAYDVIRMGLKQGDERLREFLPA